jgi:transcriptional regulator with XRE-family HTH domain/quercetin dioxygenase-like cupin family protein
MTQARTPSIVSTHPGAVLNGVGERLRSRRKQRGLSVRETARRIGVSASLVSMIENGKARPSVSTLYALVQELDLALDTLLDGSGTPSDHEISGTPTPTPLNGQHGPRLTSLNAATLNSPLPTSSDPAGKLLSAPLVQRGDKRDALPLEGGVLWERLTPRDVPGGDFLQITYDVGCASSPEGTYQTHGGHEFGLVVTGRLAVSVGFETIELNPGDSIYFDSSNPHRLVNIGDEPAVGIWIIHP